MSAFSSPAEEAKARTDLVRLIESHGVKLSLNGQGLKGLCPFHEEKSPSFCVTPERGLWHCFGCGLGGSAIDFVMRKEGVPVERAIASLLARAGDAPARALAAPTPLAPDVDLLERARDAYEKGLANALKAREYLAKRGLLERQLVDRFRLGYGDGSVKNAVPREAGQAAGVLNRNGVDFFYRCLVFPITDLDGRVVSFYGRHVGERRHLYLRGPHRGIFHWQAARDSRSIVLAESIVDALSAYRLGCPSALALYGLNGLTDDHLALFRRYETAEVTLLLDNDEPAETALPALVERLKDLPLRVLRARLPEGVKDLNDFLTGGATAGELAAVLEARELLAGPTIVPGAVIATPAAPVAEAPVTARDPSGTGAPALPGDR